MSDGKSNGRVYLGLLTGSLFWGTSFAAAKIGMRQLSPMNLVIARFTLASTLFAALLLLGGSRARLQARDVPRFLVLGFLVISSYFYIQYVALHYTTTVVSSLIIAFSPIFTALLSHALGRGRLGRLGLAGIAVAFLGVALIITHGRWRTLLESSNWRGDCLLMLNALVWAGFTLYGQTLVRSYPPLVAIAYVHIAGALPLLPLIFLATPLTPVPLATQFRHLAWPTFLAALYLAAACSVFAYQMWYRGVAALGPVRTSVFLYLTPLFAILAALVLLHERLTPVTILGGALVILGVYATNASRRATPATGA